jgi:hypothetical protein
MSDRANLAAALLAAQGEMPAVDKDGTNPHFKSRFTTLGNLISKVRPVLNKNGLALIQAPSIVEGIPCLHTTILHESGESMEFDAPLSAAKNDPQGQGSAITYMRRYALASALAIADQEDDDGNAAQPDTGQERASAPSSDRMGFASEKQEGFFKRKLADQKVSPAGVAVICDYLKSRPRSDVSTAIDAVAGEGDITPQEMVPRLTEAASKYAEIQAAKESGSESFEGSEDGAGTPFAGAAA